MTAQPIQPLTRKECVILTLFFASAFLQSVIIAILGPLFPPEAESKGLTPYQYGLVNGIASLVAMFLSPVVGHYIDAIGLQKILVWSTLFNGIVPIVIGLADFTTNFVVYCVLTVLIRMVMGILNVAIVSTKYSLCFSGFPGRPSTAVGISESGFLLGTCIGPMIGTALKSMCGFGFAFIAVGVVQCLVGLILILFLPKIDITEQPRLTASQTVAAYLKILNSKSILIFIFGMCLAETGFAYVSTILEPGLRIFNLTVNQVGLMFFAKGICQVFAPFWGMILDSVAVPHAVYAFGYIIAAVGIGIFSPLPFIPSTATLAAIGLVVYGTGQGILDIACICCFQLEYLELEKKTRGRDRKRTMSQQFHHIYADIQIEGQSHKVIHPQGKAENQSDHGKSQQPNSEANELKEPETKQSMVAIVYLMSSSIGGFAGAGISGSLLEVGGFPIAMFFLGAIFLIFGIFLYIFICLRAWIRSRKYKERSSDETYEKPI